MKKMIATLLPLLACVCVWAQEGDEETYTVASCSLAVKTTVYPALPDDRAGRVMVEGILCDKAGNPIPNQEIQMVATSGTFSCIPPESFASPDETSSERSCFITGSDGKIRVYLTSIPFNKQGRLKATCTYKECSVKA
jgi:hypothetical protein